MEGFHSYTIYKRKKNGTSKNQSGVLCLNCKDSKDDVLYLDAPRTGLQLY